MSEPLSSTEIEDVLSSIRRLVSEDLRPLQRLSAVNQPPAMVVNGDKLILTPALRVVQAQVEIPVAPGLHRLHLGVPAQDQPTTAAAASRGFEPAVVEHTGLDMIVTAVGAAVGGQSSDWEAETGDAAPMADHGFAQADWDTQPDDAPFFDDSLAIMHDEADLILPSQDDLPPEAVPQHPAQDAFSSIPGWAQQDPEIGLDQPNAAEPDIATHGTIEPDQAWADAAEASVIAQLSAQLQDDDADIGTSPGADDDGSMLFDETVLRELVRDILREELAGRMGERITRNIRKLVRAEIARSFASQEFE